MSYVQGFLLAVPKARKEEYRHHAAASWPIFQRLGCLSVQEKTGAWMSAPEAHVLYARP